MSTLNFEVSSPEVTATLQKNRTVKLQFGTQADAEQFVILLSEAARMNAKLSLYLRPFTGSPDVRTR